MLGLNSFTPPTFIPPFEPPHEFDYCKLLVWVGPPHHPVLNRDPFSWGGTSQDPAVAVAVLCILGKYTNLDYLDVLRL